MPLAGVRVIELGQYIAGPGAAMILAEIGAEVIKVEPLTGDPMRQYVGRPMFSLLNRNKFSVGLDLKRADGRDVYLKLVQSADVVLDNLLLDTVEKLGIGYSVLSVANPRVIYCGIRGFLPGPREHNPLFDGAAQMLAGVAYMTGAPGRPIQVGVPIGDFSVAVWSALAILAALRARDVTGTGQHVKVGLFEAALYLCTSMVAEASVTGHAPPPLASRDEGGRPRVGVYRYFRTRDDRTCLIQVISDPQWERFCVAFSLQDLWEDADLRHPAGRAARYLELEARMEPLVRQLSATDLVALLEQHAVPHAIVNSPFDVLSDEHVKMSGDLLQIPWEEGKTGTVEVPALPFRMDRLGSVEPRAAPRVGGSSRRVLQEIGVSATEIDRLVADGVLAT
jgi:crotonobetainyl-CoA:carnitine CoA-transferase CaiB-like acyl-CoA transferase